jgi:hypothetical protein
MRGWPGTVRRKAGVIVLVFALLAFAIPLFLTENVTAQDDVQWLWGMIYESDGTLLPYDTDFRVWVQHNSIWKGFPSNSTWDPVGTMGGWYSYTLPEAEKGISWTDGDLYRIQIDCSPSGDLAENATSNGTSLSGDAVSPRGSYNNVLNWSTGGGENNSQGWDVVCSQVDLIPTDMKINGQPYSPPMAVAPFSTVTISANVTNIGRPMISEPNTIVLRNGSGVIDQDTAVTIDAGSSAGPFDLIWGAPSSGYFCFNVTVDYYDNVTETNENNNDAMVCFAVGAADHTPSGIGITTNYGTWFYGDASATNYRSDLISITPGTTATIMANVTNVGTLASGASSVEFYFTIGEGGPPEVGPPILQSAVNPLGPGGSDGIFSTPWLASTPGMYYINITADVDNDVVEINELNNTFIVRFHVGYPDYTPWNVTPSSPQDVSSGYVVTIESEVSNVGALSALSVSTIAFYNETTPGTPFFTDTNVPRLDPGQGTSPYTASWVAPVVTGATSYNVTIEVDYYSEIEEEDELNNTATIQFWVHPGPITTLNPGDPHHWIGQDLYVKSTTLLNFTVDTTADWVHTEYWVDYGGTLNYSVTGEFTISPEGLHILNYSSFDSFGHFREVNRTQRVIVDDSPPITTLNITEPKYASGGETWVKGSTPIYLNWTRDDEPDLAVGRDFTRYRIFGLDPDWTAWTNYTGVPFNLGLGDGLRYVEWFSADFLTNTELTQNRTAYVDDTGPETELHIGEPKYDRDGIPYIEDTTDLSHSADDLGGCGVGVENGYEDIEYRLDGETVWRPYTGSFNIGRVGEHIIYFRSTDNLGNVGDIVTERIFVLGPNYKPIIAIIFVIIMIIAGAAVGYKRPLLMARKRIREAEDQILKEEEEMEKAMKEAEGATAEEPIEVEPPTEVEVDTSGEEVV